MIAPNETTTRCSLCPAMCKLEAACKGPDMLRVEYPLAPGWGLCPRGTALGELLAAPQRLRWPRRREGGKLVDAGLVESVAAAAARMAGGATVLIDGASLSIEEIASAAQVAAAWRGVRLCAVIWPEDQQLLGGIEASGAKYLAEEELAGCDGLLIIGDVFASNPRTSRPILDARRANPRAPIVVIDSGGGIVLNYATHAFACKPGEELALLNDPRVTGVVGGCKKLGVVVAAQAGRGAIWQRLGFRAGNLATQQGGGVCAATVGVNALAVLRMRKLLGVISLAEAMTPAGGANVRVAVGVDMLGLLGWQGPAAVIAAAAVPNATTASAELILPVALPCEVGGTYLQAGQQTVALAPLLAPPAGVPTTSQLLRLLAAAAGVHVPAPSGKLPPMDRLTLPEPPEPPKVETGGRVVVAYRQALQHAEGALTNAARWQAAARPIPEVRVGPADAAELGVADLDQAELQTGGGVARVLVRVRPMPKGVLAVSEGFAAARRLVPYVVDAERDAVVSPPAPLVALKRVAAEERYRAEAQGKT